MAFLYSRYVLREAAGVAKSIEALLPAFED